MKRHFDTYDNLCDIYEMFHVSYLEGKTSLEKLARVEGILENYLVKNGKEIYAYLEEEEERADNFVAKAYFIGEKEMLMQILKDFRY